MRAVQFRIFGGIFILRLASTLITVVMLAALVGLGIWQIHRLHWKENLIAEIRERMQVWPVDVGLSVIPPDDISTMDYRPGRASGVFDNNHALYLNATSVDTGDGGYDVLTPLALDNGSVLLVNRGWMPYSLKNKPESGDPEQSLYRPVGSTQVAGILRLPMAKKPWGRPANDTVKNDWYWIDLPAMAQAAGIKEFLPYVLEAADAPHDGSYPVGGQTRITLPNNHLSYAITWFALAVALPFIWFLSGWRRNEPEKAGEADKAPEPDR